MRFRRGWWSVLDEGRSYDDESYARLPRLPEHRFTGTFDWLAEGAAGPDACYMTPNPSFGPLRNDLGFPAPFKTFMASGEYDWQPQEFVDAVIWEAPHFEHFLYRFWIENVAWYGGPAARDYAAERNEPGRPPLDVRPAPIRGRGEAEDQPALF